MVISIQIQFVVLIINITLINNIINIKSSHDILLNEFHLINAALQYRCEISFSKEEI